MSKLLLIAIAAGIAALIFGGVLDVEVHPDRLGEVPDRLMGLVGEKSTYETMRARVVGFKRTGELWLVKDIDKQMDLGFKYVEADVERLDRVLAKNEDNPENVLPQAELLVRSINRIGDLLIDAPVDRVAGAREETKRVLGEARDSLSALQEIQGQNEALEEELAAVTSVLEWNIGQIDADAAVDGVSAVAGAKDEEDEGEASGSVPQSTGEEIPLSF